MKDLTINNVEYKFLSYNEEGEYQDDAVQLIINSEVQGFISFSSNCIEDVEIRENFRGKGFYTGLIKHALIMGNEDTLCSNNRNSDYSNPAWEHWTGEELEIDDTCYVCLENEKLDFWKED